MKYDQLWNWCFCGKHPAARDYFTLGKHVPMSQAFADWVQRGYYYQAGKNEKPEGAKSWRFWSKTPARDQLVCGLLRSSCDAIGRPYPLLMIGTGTLDAWEQNLDLLPFACEKVWRQFEHISSRQYKNLERLKLDMNMLQPPDNHWQELKDTIPFTAGPGASTPEITPGISQEVLGKVAKILEDREIFMALKPKTSENLFLLIAKWHQYIKTYSAITPNVLFMGGTMHQTFLVVFQRPLNPDDFTLLWDLPALELR